jgi:hypothetical protein
MQDVAAGESRQLSPHHSICNIFSSCHNRRHDRKGIPGWLRKLPIDTALKDTDDQMLPLRPR